MIKIYQQLSQGLASVQVRAALLGSSVENTILSLILLSGSGNLHDEASVCGQVRNWSMFFLAVLK